ncbi:hypothetical protein [Chryseobacterium sp.]|uniref:hypothetical protein n=1 Tax=Chryseobacterium sp. TaxID=1871047 RepID=UPI0025BA45D6|nr:hypothetical protein [Chryseobacterium sp.]
MIIFYSQLRNQKFGWPDQQDNFFEVSVNFENVSSLKIDFDYNYNGLQQVSGFDIIDVSNNGLEFIHYQIEDYENDTIHFYCEDIIILDVSSPVKLKFMT